jgi:hypothetical protein
MGEDVSAVEHGLSDGGLLRSKNRLAWLGRPLPETGICPSFRP